MDSALEFFAAPPASPRIVGIVWNRSARLATDASIALIVLGQIRYFLGGCVFPYLPPGPIGKWTYFGEGLSAGVRCNSTFFKFLRVMDCSRRRPVNQIS